jgi:hypothetical protein
MASLALLIAAGGISNVFFNISFIYYNVNVAIESCTITGNQFLMRGDGIMNTPEILDTSADAICHIQHRIQRQTPCRYHSISNRRFMNIMEKEVK